MPRRTPILLSWSSGKDSAWALQILREARVWDVVGLVTTVNTAFDRVAMHGVRRDLLEAQARAVGVPLWPVPIPFPCSNGQYEAALGEVIRRARAEGIGAMAFGDLYLEDIRRYREEKLRGTGVEPVFPIWGSPTGPLAREMIRRGLRARLVCVDPRALPAALAGREFDGTLLADLPPGADPCGERGEFHTFAYDGPMFANPIPVRSGAVVERDGFVFADLEPPAARREPGPGRLHAP